MCKRYKNLAAGILLLTGLIMIVIGIQRKEPATVLQKAVNVCMECIGIG